jgi:hypothetical protein
MGVLEVQWSRALSLVCEVALIIRGDVGKGIHGELEVRRLCRTI